MLQVVVGALVREGRVLLAHRGTDKRVRPGLWDLPGGVVEPGESELDALARELREELGVEVSPDAVGRLARVVAGPDDDPVSVSAWLVGEWQGTPANLAPEEHDLVAWFDVEELPPPPHVVGRAALVDAMRRGRAHLAPSRDHGRVSEHVGRATPESVWDYPRPPVVVPSSERVVIELGGEVVVDTRRSLRVLETSHPPVYYLPVDAVRPGLLRPVGGTTWCEYKGVASYFDIASPSGRVISRAAWHYPDPTAGYEDLAGHVAFYPGQVDRCTVDGETVVAQPGDFYGGWITSRVTGPFKGAPGTSGW